MVVRLNNMSAENEYGSSHQIDPKILQREKIYNYDAFSRSPEYRQVNRELLSRLVDKLPENDFFHIDIASGTGLVPQEMIVLCEAAGKRGTIIAVEPDPKAIEKAKLLTPQSEFVNVEYVVGFGQDLELLLKGKIPESGADSASLLGAIHEIPGADVKRDIVKSVYGVLKENGRFALNSAFTTVGMEGAKMKYGKWRLKAMVDVLKGSTRGETRDTTEIYSPDDYTRLLTHLGYDKNPLTLSEEELSELPDKMPVGFNIDYREDRKLVVFTRKSLNAISVYPRFVEGFLEGFVPGNGNSEPELEEKSKALVISRRMNKFDSLPRNMFEIIAVKPETQQIAA